MWRPTNSCSRSGWASVDRRQRGTLAAVLTVALSGCGSGGVSIERTYSPETDFGRYSTYAWSTPSGELTRSPLINEDTDAKIRSAIDQEMARIGFRKADVEEESHLTIGYLVTVESRVERPAGGPDDAATGRYGGVYDTSPLDRWIEEGTMEVGIVDRRMERVVWKGTARMDLDSVTDIRDRERRVDRIVRELFDHFPGG